MLNEERIKLMTKMAAYEANEGKRNVAVSSYFRGDYIGLQVIKSIISATIAFLIVFAMFCFSFSKSGVFPVPLAQEETISSD